MKEHFIRALNGLKSMLLNLASSSEEALKLSIEAVDTHNNALAQKVIDNDELLDMEEIKIEEECLKILALYQVVATDLREVVTILKVNNELERVGDLAVNIAEIVHDISKFEDSEIEKIDFSSMVTKVRYMLQKSIDSMTYHDGEEAKTILKYDDEVDAIHYANRELIQNLILKHPDKSTYYLHCLTISRCLERIGDIATNICEDVIYLEYGKIVRHLHDGEN